MEKTGENMKGIFETLLKARDTCVHMDMYHMHIHTYTPHIHGPHVCVLTYIHTCTHGHVTWSQYHKRVHTLHTCTMYMQMHRERENFQIKTRLWKEGNGERTNNRPYEKLSFPLLRSMKVESRYPHTCST